MKDTTILNRCDDIAAMTDSAAAAMAMKQLENEIFDGEVAEMVTDADSDVSANLYDDLLLARTEAEYDAIETLIATRHVWLDAHFRDSMSGRAGPSPAAAEADRLWAVVAAERRAPGYADRVLISEAEFWVDVPY